jgi:hypothetical protein
MGRNLTGKISARSDEIPYCVVKYYTNYNLLKEFSLPCTV